MTENNTSNSKKIHHGRTLKSIRESYGWKQDVMAEKLDVVQQTISKYEALEIVDDGVLKKYAEAFHVPISLLKNFKTEAPSTEYNYYGEVHIEGDNACSDNNNTYNYSDCPDKFSELSRKKGDILDNLSKVDQERSTEIKQVLDSILDRLSNLESKINAK